MVVDQPAWIRRPVGRIRCGRCTRIARRAPRCGGEWLFHGSERRIGSSPDGFVILPTLESPGCNPMTPPRAAFTFLAAFLPRMLLRPGPPAGRHRRLLLRPSPNVPTRSGNNAAVAKVTLSRTGSKRSGSLPPATRRPGPIVRGRGISRKRSASARIPSTRVRSNCTAHGMCHERGPRMGAPACAADKSGNMNFSRSFLASRCQRLSRAWPRATLRFFLR